MEDENKQNDEYQLYNNLYYPSYKVHCDRCEKDITKHTKIYCPECEIDLCVNCFLEGVSFGKHLQNHPYHVINKLNFPLYQEDWTAEEELLLFEGLERFGFGNWHDIAEHIGTDKQKEDVEKHYEDFYLAQDKKNFLPVSFQLQSKRDPETLELQVSSKVNKNQMQQEEQKNKKKTAKTESKTGSLPTTGTRTTTLTTAVNNQSGNASEIVGYMPNRGDFDIEYDNDAELLLAEMEFNDDDKEGEIEMKFKLLDIYNARLDERIKRKKFVIERGLLNLKKQNNLDKERSKEEKEIYNMMKVFSRFNQPEEHEKLVQGIIKEKQIRQRIEELRTYRKLGMKTFEEVENYLQEKKKKDEAYQKKQKQNENYVYEKPIQSSRLTPSRRTRSINKYLDPKKDQSDKKRNIPPNMNEQESQLCEKLGISPYEYLVIKEVLVREAVKEQFIKKDQAENILKLDKERITGIFDFLVAHNYIMEKK